MRYRASFNALELVAIWLLGTIAIAISLASIAYISGQHWLGNIAGASSGFWCLYGFLKISREPSDD